MKRFVFAVTLALALLAGSQNAARANGGFTISIGFGVSGNFHSGYCPSPYDNFAPSYAPYGYGYGADYGPGYGYGYYAPYPYYGGYGY